MGWWMRGWLVMGCTKLGGRSRDRSPLSWSVFFRSKWHGHSPRRDEPWQLTTLSQVAHYDSRLIGVVPFDRIVRSILRRATWTRAVLLINARADTKQAKDVRLIYAILSVARFARVTLRVILVQLSLPDLYFAEFALICLVLVPSLLVLSLGCDRLSVLKMSNIAWNSALKCCFGCLLLFISPQTSNLRFDLSNLLNVLFALWWEFFLVA